MKGKPHVVVVNGYGCHLDTPLGDVYLPRVVRFINETQPDLIVFSGGETQRKTAPGISEAELMRKFVMPRLDRLPEKGFGCDAHSYTTLENACGAAIWVNTHLSSKKVRVTFCCEATRAANVVMVGRHFFYGLIDSIDDLTVETASWERADPFKQVQNLLYNKLAITYPWLGLAERERNKRIRRSYHA